nr:stress response protein NST1-like [Leptinotarsa decemlineata]
MEYRKLEETIHEISEENKQLWEINKKYEEDITAMKEIIISMKGRIDELLTDKEEQQKKTKENNSDQKKHTRKGESEKQKREKGNTEGQRQRGQKKVTKTEKVPKKTTTTKEDPRTTKRPRDAEVSSETDSDEDGFQRVESKKSRKARKKTEAEIHEETEMDAETTSIEMEAEATPIPKTSVPTDKRKTPEVPVWPTTRPHTPQTNNTEGQNSEEGEPTPKMTSGPPMEVAKPPPIVIHDSKKWSTISKSLEARKIGYNKAKLTIFTFVGQSL